MARSGTQRTFVSLAAFAVIAVVFGYFAYSKFIGSKDVEAGPVAPKVPEYDISRFNTKNLDKGLFERDDFLDLKPDTTRHRPVDAIVTGKTDPFSAATTTE